MAKLSDIISFNSDFKNAINLYLNLNKADKIKSYIPTKSSVDILHKYLDAVENNKRQATLLIGPYGKGKSHLILVLLAILSLSRDKSNEVLIKSLVSRISKVDKKTGEVVDGIWSRGKFLPVIIMSTQGDLNQAFLVGLNDALKREGLKELAPETFFTHAIETITKWESEYPETYKEYKELLQLKKIATKDMHAGLVNCVSSKLEIFKQIYPKLSSGGTFNPLASSEVLPMYKSIADKLKEEYGFSGIYIVFDEFSKYIEGQDKQSTGNNMKLLQDVCELANDSKDSQVFITMVAHKSIKEYGKYLSVETINSFTGIEGRIEEVLFVTSSKNNYELIENAIYKDEDTLVQSPATRVYVNAERVDNYFRVASFPAIFTKKDFEKTVVRGCYPLTPTSAYLLLNVSEKVAQNERTLFTFISKDEQYSMARYVKEITATDGTGWIVNADLIYDYFKGIFKKDMMNEYVHNEWLNAEYALSKTTVHNQIRLLKTLAIINIVNKPDELPANKMHLGLASGIPNLDETIEKLESMGLIYKKGFNECYVFKTRATSQLKKEIRRRKGLRGDRASIGQVLSQISEIYYVLPKKYNNEFTMTRFFRYEYMSVEEFLNIDNDSVFFSKQQFCDGKIIALFTQSEVNYSDQIKEKIARYQNGKLVVLYNSNVFNLLDQLQEYEVIQELKKDVTFFSVEENKVLLKEMPIIEEDLESVISKYVEDTFGDDSGKITYFFNEEKVKVSVDKKLSEVIDTLCYEIYPAAISVNNELINKENVSTPPIKKSRKIIIETLLSKSETESFMKGTSSEATIYRALFVGTGIIDEKYQKNVKEVLDIFDLFILGASMEKSSLLDLINELTSEPIGMRRGIIPIYLAFAISKRNEDIIIYFDKKEVAITPDIILNMCETPEDYYIYISLEDVKKEKYIADLCNMFSVQNNQKLTDSRIANAFTGMQRWFRSLPQVTKNIRRQEDYFGNESLSKAFPKIKTILQSIEANPYEAVFVELPKAFEAFGDLEKVIQSLNKLKRKLNGYFEWMGNKAVEETKTLFSKKSKGELYHILNEWYEKQSNIAKQGLHSTRVTRFMACISENKTYDEIELIKRIIKSTTEVYLDSWNDKSLENYLVTLEEIKIEVEAMSDEIIKTGRNELVFIDRNGKKQKRYYEFVDESTGLILRNIIEESLEDFSDLSVNDKVAILIEMIEKVLE